MIPTEGIFVLKGFMLMVGYLAIGSFTVLINNFILPFGNTIAKWGEANGWADFHMKNVVIWPIAFPAMFCIAVRDRIDIFRERRHQILKRKDELAELEYRTRKKELDAAERELTRYIERKGT